MLRYFWIFLATCLLTAAGPFAAASASDSPPVPEVPEGAYAEDAFDDGEPRVAKRLLVDADTVASGERLGVGVLFEMDPGWHIYWHDAGQGGMSTEVIFEATGGTPASVMWPEPTVYHEAGGTIITFGYGDRVLLFTEVDVDDDADGQVEVSAAVDYLVCEIDCIPGDAELHRTVDVGDDTTESDATKPFFDDARSALPRPPEETGVDVEVRYSHTPIENPDDFRVEISAIGCREAGEENCVELGAVPDDAADALMYRRIDTISLEVARVSPHPDAHSGWFVELDGRASRDRPSDDGRLQGVLALRDAEGNSLATTVDELFPRTDSERAEELVVKSAVEADPDAPTETPSDSGLSLWYVLILAFLGGAILNLMPCVFPVLAVKVFAFIDLAHEHRQSVYAHSASYTGGIVASMMVLAAAVIALQFAGTQVGWGFQFQEPWFIAVVGAVVVVFALNLFGVFEVTVDPGRLENVTEQPASYRRSFGEGVLAVVLATPCSAPFLGTAVGFALASPPWVVALCFAVLGLGLAAPFVILTAIPGTARILPEPGAWMMHFKHVLGFALLATAIWLVWLIGRMAGADGIVRLLIFLLSCGIGAWIFGLVQFKSPRARRVGLAASIALVVITGAAVLEFDEADPSDLATEDAEIAWQEWSEEAVQSELDAGRPVFVDFTADWCITCKVNLANAIEQPAVIDAVDEHDVAMFKADWTHRDERIRSKLAEFGKGGVPMYLVYSPEAPQDPELLPEVLTQNMVASALEEAAP